MKLHEKMTVTMNTRDSVEACYDFDAWNSKLIATEDDSETYELGPYKRTYWFDKWYDEITHTQLQFDENWVEPEETE